MKNYLILIIAFLLSASIVQSVSAQNVDVGLYVISLGKFDVATGTFTADFYLSMKCDKPCKSDNFEFMNGRATSIDQIIDKPNEKFHRIQANLNSQVNLKKFPFDTQIMQIILEDKNHTINQISYVPLLDESGIDKSIAFTGWDIRGWKAEIRQHDYPVYNEIYSQYVFNIEIKRIIVNSFIKTFLPVFFIVLVVLFTFLLDPDKIAPRLTMISSSLVAAVMFHVSIANQIPPVGYLTFADKFMILTYFVILTSFVISVIILQLHELKKFELLEKVHRATEYSMFFIVPILYLNLFILLL